MKRIVVQFHPETWYGAACYEWLVWNRNGSVSHGFCRNELMAWLKAVDRYLDGFFGR